IASARVRSFGGHVKRIVVALFAALLTLPAFAIDTTATVAADRDRNRDVNIVDEVIRMWKSNVAEDDIIAYVRKADTRFVVTADDWIAMSDAKVPRTVIKAVLDEADYRGDRSRSDGRRAVVVRPYPYYGGWYGPGWYDPWYYDPFWYGYSPRISIGFGVGFGRVHRPHHRPL